MNKRWAAEMFPSNLSISRCESSCGFSRGGRTSVDVVPVNAWIRPCQLPSGLTSRPNIRTVVTASQFQYLSISLCCVWWLTDIQLWWWTLPSSWRWFPHFQNFLFTLVFVCTTFTLRLLLQETQHIDGSYINNRLSSRILVFSSRLQPWVSSKWQQTENVLQLTLLEMNVTKKNKHNPPQRVVERISELFYFGLMLVCAVAPVPVVGDTLWKQVKLKFSSWIRT